MKIDLHTLLPFLSWRRAINRQSLPQDLLAGLTGAVLVLPQGVAYAFIAGLPAQYGLYTAIITPIIASLFGSSWHLVSGPTAAISIVVMSVASQAGQSPQDYLTAVLTLTLLAGAIQLGMGLLRLGSLVNFISHTVVIGFTAGAAILIAASQLKHLFGLALPNGLSFLEGLATLTSELGDLNPYALAVGLTTLVVALLVRKLNRRLPHLLIGMGAGSLLCYLLNGAEQGVALVGALPGSLPPFALPSLDGVLLQNLTSGAFAVALLGLIEAVSIARAIALRSQQQIDGNQEFIGQGLSNLVGSFFSCFVGSGSFTRSGANYDAGARTPLAAIFAAIILALIVLLAPGITAYLPLSAMAGTILLIAWNLIDFHHIREILRSNRNEALVLLVTFFATLLIELEFAIYIGVFLSLALYLRRTSRPTVMEVAPVPDHPQRAIRNVSRYQLNQCPDLKIVRLDGSLFFGAIDHVQQQLRALGTAPGSQILIIGKGINFIDIAGAQMLIQEAHRLELAGGQLMISSLKGTVIDELRANGYLDRLGEHRIAASPESAIEQMINQIPNEKCSLCDRRVFTECNQRPRGAPERIPLQDADSTR